MAAIVRYADRLLDSETTASEHCLRVQTVRCNGEHLPGSLDEVRELSKLAAGQLKVGAVPGSPIDLTGVRMIDGLRESRLTEKSETPPSMPRLEDHGCCSVLLAEDGRDNQLLISTVLRKAGAAVTVAENGRIAVEKALAARAAGAPFDVILMDMQMPELDGYTATAMLRHEGYLGPVVALTAHEMAGDRERCLSAGCTDYLIKSIDRTRLVQMVAQYAHREQQGRPEPTAAATPICAPPLCSEFAADADMAPIIAKFVAGLPARMQVLRASVEAGQGQAAARLSHQLKGAAGSFGFGIITEAAARLERACKQQKSADELLALVAELEELCGRASSLPSVQGGT